MKSALHITTSANEFHHIPSVDRYLFTVQGGLPADMAVGTSRCILESLIQMANDGLKDGGINQERSYTMGMLLEMVDGLVGSLEGQV